MVIFGFCQCFWGLKFIEDIYRIVRPLGLVWESFARDPVAVHGGKITLLLFYPELLIAADLRPDHRLLVVRAVARVYTFLSSLQEEGETIETKYVVIAGLALV